MILFVPFPSLAHIGSMTIWNDTDASVEEVVTRITGVDFDRARVLLDRARVLLDDANDNLEGAVALHFGALVRSPPSHTASRMSEAALMREEDRHLEISREDVSLSPQAPSVRGLSAAACTSASSSAAAGCREELHATCFTTTITPRAKSRAPWQRCRLDDEGDIRFRSQVYRFRIRMQQYFFSSYLLCASTVISALREAVSTDRGPGKVLAEVLAACEQDLSIVQRLVRRAVGDSMCLHKEASAEARAVEGRAKEVLINAARRSFERSSRHGPTTGSLSEGQEEAWCAHSVYFMITTLMKPCPNQGAGALILKALQIEWEEREKLRRTGKLHLPPPTLNPSPPPRAPFIDTHPNTHPNLP